MPGKKGMKGSGGAGRGQGRKSKYNSPTRALVLKVPDSHRAEISARFKAILKECEAPK